MCNRTVLQKMNINYHSSCPFKHYFHEAKVELFNIIFHWHQQSTIPLQHAYLSGHLLESLLGLKLDTDIK